MLKFIIIAIAASTFAYYTYVTFDEAFGDDSAVIDSRQ